MSNSSSTLTRRSRSSIGAVRNPASTEAILSAAAEILEEAGYRAFTIEAVCKRAGASKPTIYRWWRNKGDLIRDVYEHSGEASLAYPNTGSMEKDLADHLHSLWDWWRTTRAGEALRSFITEIQLDPTSLANFREDFLARRERVLRAIFSRAIARGDLRPDASVDAAVAMLTGMSWLHLLTDNLETESAIDEAIQILCAGIRAAS